MHASWILATLWSTIASEGENRLTDVARPREFGGTRVSKRAAAHSLVANLFTRTVRSLVSVISRT